MKFKKLEPGDRRLIGLHVTGAPGWRDNRKQGRRREGIITGSVAAWGGLGLLVVTWDNGEVLMHRHGFEGVYELRLLKKKKTRTMTHAEIFQAIHEGALVKSKNTGFFSNTWDSELAPSEFKISYDWGETWQEMV